MHTPHGSPDRPLLRGVSHQVAFFAAILAAAWLVTSATGRTASAAAWVYGSSLVAMFGASMLLHRTRVSPRAEKWLERIDHSTIFLFIAGTATPFCLLLGPHRYQALALMWTAAGLGVLRAMLWIDAPRVVTVAQYLLVGWLGVLFFVPLWHALGTRGIALIAAGGLMYSVGAVVFALQRPNPLPKLFGFHEIFHALVVAGCACIHIPVAQAIAHLG